ADFSLNIAIIGEREEVVDYTVGYFNDPLTFCTSKPRPLNQALALIRPFKPLMWVGITGALVVICVMYYVACQVTRPHTSTSFSLVLLNIFGAFLSQGCHWSVGKRAAGAGSHLDHYVSGNTYLVCSHAYCLLHSASALPDC
ncbi:hypothetical protein OTU49_015331, partial [Cherax quadricarinatus]